jgi:hypothetical protein
MAVDRSYMFKKYTIFHYALCKSSFFYMCRDNRQEIYKTRSHQSITLEELFEKIWKKTQVSQGKMLLEKLT